MDACREIQRVGAVMDEKKRELELEEIERIKAELAELKRRKDILDAIPPKKRRSAKAKKQAGSRSSSHTAKHTQHLSLIHISEPTRPY